LALASVAFIGLLSHGRRDLVLLMWVYALVLAGGIALYFASGRLRMPIMFPTTILAAMFIAEGWEWLRLQRVQRSGHLRLSVFTLRLGSGSSLSWGVWWGVR